MPLFTPRDGDLVTTMDPTAQSLRSVLHADLATVLIADRHREIQSFVARERLVEAALESLPARRSTGMRHLVAAALIALARKLEAESLEAAMRGSSPQLD